MYMLKSVKLSGCQVVKFDPWDFCFHVYAQKSLLIGENVNDFFLQPHPHTHLLRDIRVDRAGSQLKIKNQRHQPKEHFQRNKNTCDKKTFAFYLW